MLGNTVVTRSLGALGKVATSTSAAAMPGMVIGATTPSNLARTSVRHLYNIRRLECPELLSLAPTTAPGLSALKKVTGESDDVLRASAKGLFDTVSKINTAAFKSKLPLARQYGLTEPETIGLALAVLQAGSKLGLTIDLNSRPVVSLVYNLLSNIPVDPHLLTRFDEYAQELVSEVIPDGNILADKKSWQSRLPEERLETVHHAFKKSLCLAQKQALTGAPTHTVSLNWDPNLGRFGAAFMVLDKSDELDDGSSPGQVLLPRQLLHADADSYGARGKRATELRNLDPALIYPLISHELFHFSQHADLDDKSGKNLASIPRWTRAVKIAMSLGAQNAMGNMSYPTACDQGRLPVHLPHEREAWALTFIIIRAMFNSPDIPAKYKKPLVNFIINNFDVFATATGIANAPKPTQSNGRLWFHGTDLHIRASQFDARQKEMAVDDFLSNRTVTQ